ncbi:MAG: RsmB/NOP family class I SAM-dependent RNA methyltransferase, partial [Chryseobacterium sp.]
IYSFFRLGKALINEAPIKRLAIADFLCNDTSSLVIEAELPLFADYITNSVSEKIELVKQHFPEFTLTDVFPFKEDISPEIERTELLASFFTQPDLFIRVKSEYLTQLKEKLNTEGIFPSEIGSATLALPIGTKLEKIVPDQKYYQVQDLSSQATGELFKPEKWDYWWDCCAASGGKSLLLHSLEPTVQLLVSDVRENSLHNLEERFRDSGIKKYQKKVLDLLQNNDQDLHHYEFDGIILDAPCTGSGTWGRTPEMLYYFDSHKVSYFSKLQKSIATNVVKYLKQGKPLIYITCSVFKAENEDVVDWMLKELPLKLQRTEVIRGYNHKADTMFAARLIKV